MPVAKDLQLSTVDAFVTSPETLLVSDMLRTVNCSVLLNGQYRIRRKLEKIDTQLLRIRHYNDCPPAKLQPLLRKSFLFGFSRSHKFCLYHHLDSFILYLFPAVNADGIRHTCVYASKPGAPSFE